MPPADAEPRLWNSVWSCLHDGEIEGIDSHGAVTRIVVSCLYAAEAMGRPEARFLVEVSGPVRWMPWDEADSFDSLDELVAREPDILGPCDEVGAGIFAITLLLPSGSGGSLSWAAGGAALRWEDGEAIEPAAFVETVDRAVHAYVEGNETPGLAGFPETSR